ncbi:MAG: hypothetical protein SPH18_07860 [Sutterella parvirubra]|nr:hypothetical protein [Sutterella parvirubra]
MKLFLTYVLLIAPAVKVVAGVFGGFVLFVWIISWGDSGCGRFGYLGAVLLALSILCPDHEAAAVLLEALK